MMSSGLGDCGRRFGDGALLLLLLLLGLSDDLVVIRCEGGGVASTGSGDRCCVGVGCSVLGSGDVRLLLSLLGKPLLIFASFGGSLFALTSSISASSTPFSMAPFCI